MPHAPDCTPIWHWGQSAWPAAELLTQLGWRRPFRTRAAPRRQRLLGNIPCSEAPHFIQTSVANRRRRVWWTAWMRLAYRPAGGHKWWASAKPRAGTEPAEPGGPWWLCGCRRAV